MEAIRWFEEIGLADVALVGGKGANLGELTTAGLPVPPGFVVAATAYLDAASKSGGRARLLSGLNVDDSISLTDTQKAAHEDIMATPSRPRSQMPSRTRIAGSGTMSPLLIWSPGSVRPLLESEGRPLPISISERSG